jgi:hypothetical protein
MERKRLRRIALMVVAVLVVAGVALGTYQVTNNGGSPSGSGNKLPSQVQLISVSGNQLMQNGKPVRLIGLNMNSAQYYCLGKNTQPLAMPIDSASISAMSSWHVNAVRILFNQDCWLGADGEPHATTSASYRDQIESLVSMLNGAHIEVILALYSNMPVVYTANGKHRSMHSQPLGDSTYSEALWTSVATTFRNDPQVMFYLYGEPHQISWPCWKNGCKIAGQQYVGMQQLVDAVRQTGARQPILLGGVDYSNNLSEWLNYEPTDPLHQLIASVHIYSSENCNNVTCWNRELSPVSRKVPVVTGEFGAIDCATTFTQRYMKWADKHAISYLAWSWFVGTCSDGLAMVSSYSGAATAYGSPFQSHLAALYSAGSGDVGSVSAGMTVAKSESKKH